METKLIEVRDSCTCISGLAIKISGEDGWLARRAGYGSECILFGEADGGPFYYDPYDWSPVTRTMRVAHEYLIDNWDNIVNEGIVDVRFILGETDTPCQSDQYWTPNSEDV